MKDSSGWASWSHPGLKVSMLPSNMPWKSPITWAPFFMMSQFCDASPPNGVNPRVS